MKMNAIEPARFFQDEILLTQKIYIESALQKSHTTENTALLGSWKKTPTAIQVPVNEFHVTFFL